MQEGARQLDKFGDPPHKFNAFTASVCNLRSTSRGHVHITSSDPRAYPAIAPNYLSTEEDQKVAANAIRLTRRIVLGSEAMKKHEPEEYTPGKNSTSQNAPQSTIVGRLMARRPPKFN